MSEDESWGDRDRERGTNRLFSYIYERKIRHEMRDESWKDRNRNRDR